MGCLNYDIAIQSLEDLPHYLNLLLTISAEESKHFLEKIRMFNRAFEMILFGLTLLGKVVSGQF